MRTLALPRIQEITLTEETFTPDCNIIKSANEEGIFDPENIENVIVQCDSYLSNIIQTRPLHPEQEILPNAGGGEVRVKKMSKYKLITWVMHQCGRATINSPAAMRSEIAEFALKTAESHKN